MLQVMERLSSRVDNGSFFTGLFFCNAKQAALLTGTIVRDRSAENLNIQLLVC